jgi:hypothetical protein
MSFYTGTVKEQLYSLPTTVTKNAYTSQAILTAGGPSVTYGVGQAPRCIIPANFFGSNPNGVGRTLFGHIAGTMACTSAATIAVVLLWNPTPGTIGTTLATPWPTLAPTAAVTCEWDFEFWITAAQAGAGTTGLTLQLNGRWQQSVVAAGVLSTAPQWIMVDTSTASLNAESQAELALAGTWSASNAANTTTVKQFQLFGCN